MSFLLTRTRTLLAATSPLSGNRATGAVTFYSATGTVQLPRGTYAMPVVGGTGATGRALAPQLLAKVVATGASATYQVGTTGLNVPMHSNLGGARHNFPAGTRFVLDPPVDGVTGYAESASGFAGGEDATGFGALKDIVIADTLDGPALDVDLRRSGLTRFPAALITFREFVPADGATSPQTHRGSRVGAAVNLYRIGYTISVVCSRQDQAALRRQEAAHIMCELSELLTDRNSADHEPLSTPAGVQIQRVVRERLRQDLFQRYVVYSMDLNVELALERRDTRTFADWLRSRLMIDKAVGSDVPEGDLRVADVTVDMRPLELEVGGEQVAVGGEDADIT